MQSKRFLDAREKAKPEHRIFVKKNLALVNQIYEILDNKGWTQKDLASGLNKSESEISKWLSGTHNLTLQTICKIESILKEEVFFVCNNAPVRIVKKDYIGNTRYENYAVGKQFDLNEFISVITVNPNSINSKRPVLPTHHVNWAQLRTGNQKNSRDLVNKKEDEQFCAA